MNRSWYRELPVGSFNPAPADTFQSVCVRGSKIHARPPMVMSPMPRPFCGISRRACGSGKAGSRSAHVELTNGMASVTLALRVSTRVTPMSSRFCVFLT